jgi:4'-phosphopantetheinyl transferase
MAVNQSSCEIYLGELIPEAQWDMSLLGTDELTHFPKLKSYKKRAQFITGRTLLKKTLGRCLGLRPMDVNILINAGGKPSCDNLGAPNFSISHSHTRVAIAISQLNIGVDIEHHKQSRNILEIASMSFSQEEFQSIQRHPSQDAMIDEFYRIWVLKESLGKITGEGIFEELAKRESVHNAAMSRFKTFTTRLGSKGWLGAAVLSQTPVNFDIHDAQQL